MLIHRMAAELLDLLKEREDRHKLCCKLYFNPGLCTRRTKTLCLKADVTCLCFSSSTENDDVILDINLVCLDKQTVNC